MIVGVILIFDVTNRAGNSVNFNNAIVCVLNGEVAAVTFLEAATKATPTKIDDAIVAIVKAALLGA